MKKRVVFPKDFLFGVATAAYQIEEENKNSQWYLWEMEGRTRGKSGTACNSYNGYRRDIKILKRLGVKAYRFSIEWSRIEPEQDKFDEEAIQHYKNILIELKRAGIKPFVTLFHFSIPIWFADKGGFEKEENICFFLDFVSRVSEEYKNLVEYWVTINEPVVYATAGYLSGIHPPGKTSLIKTIRVFKNLVLTHMRSYEVIKDISKKAQVGIVKQESVFEPLNNSYLLVKLVNFIKYFFNELFLKSIFEGNLFFPLTFFSKKIPRNMVDFVGLNYYYRFHTEFSNREIGLLGKKSFVNFSVPKDKKRSDQLGLEIYPYGIYQLLKALKKYGTPVYITENGLATKYEDKRMEFIREHLMEVNRAINEGVDVKGYFYWTLFDNFEWHLGYMPKFGLMTRNKKKKKSFDFYKKICKTRELEPS